MYNRQVKVFDEHINSINGIEFSPFNGGKYLCSASSDKTIRLWDIETPKSLHVFNGHENRIWCVDISPLQSNDNNKSNSMGVIGGNGYTICSGSLDNSIRLWDIETTKQFILFKGHNGFVFSVKYGSSELRDMILSGSQDTTVRLWDIRSGQQIRLFNGHLHSIMSVGYSPFVVDNSEIGGISNVICSGSLDNTIRFWDIRSNKKELYVIKESRGIICLKFLESKKKTKSNSNISLCYGSANGPVRIWG
ncbi:hypothetical protein RFI_38108 [Reticulomyxa filosa]|uniref:Uncharacterized protein n=1 Tax=Reticulomyxa filosa TaxID=46433 RepID=X6LCY4_RETFI|nr:hypothetical protein RFI_38108 [Reticulomyxa filosa]|eukprot:ETN99373.1 hypothetical protein RFI_38108 [Reticulomyxa filosa]